MKSWRAVAVGACGAALIQIAPMPAVGGTPSEPAPGAKPSSAAAVLEWSALAEAVVSAGRGPGPAAVHMATVHVAIHDAVIAIEGGSAAYAVTPDVVRPASLAAAVATAAHGVLVARIPEQAAEVGLEYLRFLRTIRGSRSKLNGIEVGVQVADAIVALRATDGLSDVVPYEQPAPGPGVFEPVAPTEPVGVNHGLVKPFAMSSSDQFRPDGPAQLDSPEYAQDFAEVKDLGRLDSEVRTAEQTETALFWSDNGFVQWSRAVLAIAADVDLDAPTAARLLAMVHVAEADAGIACFDAKYHYLFWRPVHAVQRADTDGNDATDSDPSWAALLTANHPEYPSGAACVNAAITQTLAWFFETDEIAFDIESAVTGTTRHYERLSDSLAEDIDARVWSGLHFRSSMEQGAELGRHVAELVTGTLFTAP